MNKQAKMIKSAATQMLKRFSIEQLCANWEETNNLEITIHLAAVRGWLQDEFERRDQLKFNTWLNCVDMNKMEHPGLFFIAK